MSCPHEAVRTWYDLIHAALEEDASRTVLDSGQIQALMARLDREKIFSDYKTVWARRVSLFSERGNSPQTEKENEEDSL